MPQSREDRKDAALFNLALDAAKIVQDDANTLGRGPTGAHPDGKLDDYDDGELELGITHQDGKVVMSFGIPIVAMGMSPNEARDIAASLLRNAAAAESAA